MEFRYKTSSIEKGLFWRALLVFLWMFIIWHRIRLFQDWSIVFSVVEVILFISYLISVFRFYRFYTIEKLKVLKLTDVGISSVIKSEEVLIQWTDIEKVEWTPVNKIDDFCCIILSSKTNQIVIGERIEGLQQIIQTIKHKVGDKFDTTEIPLELKLTH